MAATKASSSGNGRKLQGPIKNCGLKLMPLDWGKLIRYDF